MLKTGTSDNFDQHFIELVQRTLKWHPELESSFDVEGNLNQVKQAFEKQFKSVEELADFFTEASSKYRMTTVKERYDKLMHMSIDKLRDKNGVFKLHEGF